MSEEFKSYVMRGATLVCDKGSHHRKINLIYDHGWGIEIKDIEDENKKEHPFMLSNDTVVGNESMAGNVQQNIAWFGCCDGNVQNTDKICLKNPDNSDNPLVTQKKCSPQIIGKWENVKSQIEVEKGGICASPLLTNQSYLTCAWGGLITIQDSGATYDGSKDRTQNAE